MASICAIACIAIAAGSATATAKAPQPRPVQDVFRVYAVHNGVLWNGKDLDAKVGGSAAIATDPSGRYVAFRGTNNNLWVWDDDTERATDTGKAVEPATDPKLAITGVNGGWQAAYQAPEGDIKSVGVCGELSTIRGAVSVAVIPDAKRCARVYTSTSFVPWKKLPSGGIWWSTFNNTDGGWWGMPLQMATSGKSFAVLPDPKSTTPDQPFLTYYISQGQIIRAGAEAITLNATVGDNWLSAAMLPEGPSLLYITPNRQLGRCLNDVCAPVPDMYIADGTYPVQAAAGFNGKPGATGEIYALYRPDGTLFTTHGIITNPPTGLTHLAVGFRTRQI